MLRILSVFSAALDLFFKAYKGGRELYAYWRAERRKAAQERKIARENRRKLKEARQISNEYEKELKKGLSKHESPKAIE